MFASFLKELGDYLGKRFLFSAFFPSLAFWGLGLATWVAGRGFVVTLTQWNGQPAEVKTILSLAFLCGVALFAYILHNLQLLLTRFYEGYWRRIPFLSWLGERLCQGQKRQRQELQKEVEVLLKQLGEEGEKAAEIHSRLQELYHNLTILYPPEERLVMPTRLGNILRAAELYPYQRYKLNAVLLWPRLYGLLPKEFIALLEDARLAMNFMLRLATLAFLFGLFWTPYWAYRGERWLALLCALGFPLAWASYQSALSPAQAYGELMKAAFDLHRWKLLKALHWPLPKTPEEEERSWKALGDFIYGGFRPQVTYVTGDEEKSKE
jgi:hypothetical protein